MARRSESAVAASTDVPTIGANWMRAAAISAAFWTFPCAAGAGLGTGAAEAVSGWFGAVGVDEVTPCDVGAMAEGSSTSCVLLQAARAPAASNHSAAMVGRLIGFSCPVTLDAAQ
jgi:hypothetical protein